VDVGALIAAGIGAAGGALAAGTGARYRNRLAVRSAARLIHAELTENTAAIRYFIQVGIWPVTSVRHSAWDTYAETLSRMRRATGFHTIQQGYSQLEGIAYLAQPSDGGPELPESVSRKILEDAIAEVRRAVQEAGMLAGVEAEALRDQLEAMQRQPPAPGAHPSMPMPSAMPAVLVAKLAALRLQPGPVPAREGDSQPTGARVSPGGRPLAGPKRTIYDAAGGEDIGAELAVARREGDPPAEDPAVNYAYDALGSFYTFFSEVFGRDSIDDDGQPLDAVVHFGQQYSNLFWDGRRIVAGDGDGQFFGSMLSSEEIVAAQLAAGVIGTDSPLTYEGQTGALQQSLGLVFGVLVKQYRLGQSADEADWTIGAEALAPGVAGTALYSLAAPGTAYKDPVLGSDPQVGHMSAYVQTVQDNGGVHLNSGIPNRAFYCVAKTLGGPTWERAGRIWYAAMRDPGLRRTSGFRRFARATVEAAEKLYGAEDAAVEAVRSGWEQVGVKPSQPRSRAEAVGS